MIFVHCAQASDSAAREQLEKVVEVLDTERCTSFQDCVAWARHRFQVRCAAPEGQAHRQCATYRKGFTVLPREIAHQPALCTRHTLCTRVHSRSCTRCRF